MQKSGSGVQIVSANDAYAFHVRTPDKVMNQLLQTDLTKENICKVLSDSDVDCQALETEECWQLTTSPRHYIMHKKHEPYRNSTYGDALPNELDYLIQQVREVFAIQEVYLTCLEAKKTRYAGYPEKVRSVFDILYAANKAVTLFENGTKSLYRYLDISHPDVKERFVRSRLSKLPEFPLADSLIPFLKGLNIEIKSKPGYRYFWQLQTEEAKKVTTDKFDKLLAWQRKHYDEEGRKFITLEYDPENLALMYIREMDSYINRRLSLCGLSSDGSSGHPVISYGNDSFYIWLALELSKDTEYRLCAICGKPFRVGNQKTVKYCKRHTKAQINYFNRKLTHEQNK